MGKCQMPLKIWLCTFWIWILTTMLSICQHDKKHEWLFCKPHVLILRLYIRSWTFISTYSWGKEYIDPHLQSLLWLQEIIYYEEQVQSSLNQIPVTMKGLRGVTKTHLEAWTVQNITNRDRDWHNLSDFVVLSSAMHWESKKQQCHTLCLSTVSHISTSCATQALFKKILVVSNRWANSMVKKFGLTSLCHSSGHTQTTYAESVHNFSWEFTQRHQHC
jgi:hypothetical protein